MQVNVGGMCQNGHEVPSYGMSFFYNGFFMVIVTFVKDTLVWNCIEGFVLNSKEHLVYIFLVDSKYASECRGHVSEWTQGAFLWNELLL